LKTVEQNQNNKMGKYHKNYNVQANLLFRNRRLTLIQLSDIKQILKLKKKILKKDFKKRDLTCFFSSK